MKDTMTSFPLTSTVATRRNCLETTWATRLIEVTWSDAALPLSTCSRSQRLRSGREAVALPWQSRREGHSAVVDILAFVRPSVTHHLQKGIAGSTRSRQCLASELTGGYDWDTLSDHLAGGRWFHVTNVKLRHCLSPWRWRFSLSL